MENQMVVSYGDSREAEKIFLDNVKNLIRQTSAVNVCEIGGGAYPLSFR